MKAKFDIRIIPFFIISFLYLSAHYYASTGDRPEFWGVDQWRFYPGGMPEILLAAGLLALFAVSFLRPASSIIHCAAESLSRIFGRFKIISWPAILLSAAVIFLLWRQRTYFLGDGYFLGRLIEKGIIFRYREFLELLLHSFLYQSITKFISLDGLFFFSLFSAACGIIFLYIVFLIARTIGENSAEGIVIYAALFLSGSLQLFFGYVENYTLTALLVAVYAYAGIDCIRKNGSIIFPGIILSLAIIAHISTIALLPSFVFLSYGNIRARTPLRIVLTISAVSAACMPLILVLAAFHFNLFPSAHSLEEIAGANHLLPLFAVTEGPGIQYALFSLPHLFDILNQAAILTPIGFLAVWILMINARNLSGLPGREILFFLVFAGSYCAEYVFFNKAIGAARDWDIFAGAALPVSVLCILLIKEYLPGQFLRILTILSVTLIFHTLPWIGVNASENMSLNRFITLAGKSPWSKYAKGYAFDELRGYFEKKGDEKRALYFADRAVAEGTQDARLMLNRANLLVKTGDLPLAMEKYEEIIRLARRYAPAYSRLGILYRGKGNYGKAEEYLTGAVRLEPENPEFLTQLGLVYFNSGDFRKAELAFEKAIDTGSDDIEPYNMLGAVHTEMGDVEKAVRYFENLDSSYPGNVHILNNLGNAYLAAGESGKATASYNRAVEINPEFGEVRRNLGNALTKSGKYREAEEAYLGAIQCDSTDVKAYNNCAVLYLESGRIDEAGSLLRRALGFDSLSAETYNNLGNVIYRKAGIDSALGYFLKAMEVNPEYNDAIYNAAVMYFQKKAFKKCMELVELLRKRKYGNAEPLWHELNNDRR